MIRYEAPPTLADLKAGLDNLFEHAGRKVRLIDKEYDDAKGSPVFTVDGKYTTRGWTEWTEGFRYGNAILHFDATGDEASLVSGRERTVRRMASHVSHIGVHDHGFNNLSTYGNLRRLMLEGRIPENEWERNFYELAIKVSGAVQAARWTERQGGGFIHSFNGPHSLFVDTIRSCRILMVAHKLGHVLMGEGDKAISLLDRALQHIESTALFNIYYGEGRDSYDVRGRSAHECVFNTKDGAFRCPNAQQGYSGFTTWTRGQSWATLGFAEELELLAAMDEADFAPFGGKEKWEALILRTAQAVADNFIENTPTDGISYWDQGGPNMYRLGDYKNRPADPFNEWEPVDSTASAITAQGLFRLAAYLRAKDPASADAKRYEAAGLVTARSLLSDPYLSTDDRHQGLLLHSIYHQPNGWDNRPLAGKAANGESSMWGDYHLMELGVYLQRLLNKGPYLTFWS